MIARSDELVVWRYSLTETLVCPWGHLREHRSYTGRQATYDLRRLRRKGIIERFGGSRRYQLTGYGRRVAVLFTKADARVLAPGLVQLDPSLPADIVQRSPLAQAWRRLDRTLDDYINNQIIAA